MQVDDCNYYNISSLSAYSKSVSTQSANFSIFGSCLEITGGTSAAYYASGTDSVDVSTKARELLGRIRELDVFNIIYPNGDAKQSTKSPKEVENDFFSDFNDFSAAFGKISAMGGVGPSLSFTMGLDGVGGMAVAGDDSSSVGKMQSFLDGNPTVVARFAVMAARASLVDAGYTVDGFSGAYASDPAAAIRDNIDVLKERLLGFRTTGSSGIMQYGFARDFNIDIHYSSTTASYSATSPEAGVVAGKDGDK